MTTAPKKIAGKDAADQPMEQIRQIAKWFAAAIPTPSTRNARTQIGVHFEEVFEMVEALGAAASTRPSREQLTFASDVLSYFQRQFKAGDLEVDFDKLDRVALLDSLCDQIVTAVGVAHMLGMDIEGALKEVAASYGSKFWEDGKPIFNQERKIMKDPRYKRPDLSKYAELRYRESARQS